MAIIFVTFVMFFPFLPGRGNRGKLYCSQKLPISYLAFFLFCKYRPDIKTQEVVFAKLLYIENKKKGA